jgi:hypothetical protein
MIRVRTLKLVIGKDPRRSCGRELWSVGVSLGSVRLLLCCWGTPTMGADDVPVSSFGVS